MENKIKKKKNIICNFLLILSLISVIGNFVVVLLLKNNKDLLINTLSSNIKFENVASHATIPIEENVIMWL